MDAVALKNLQVETPDLVAHFSLGGNVLAAKAPRRVQRLQERVQVLFRIAHQGTRGRMTVRQTTIKPVLLHWGRPD